MYIRLLPITKRNLNDVCKKVSYPFKKIEGSFLKPIWNDFHFAQWIFLVCFTLYNANIKMYIKKDKTREVQTGECAFHVYGFVCWLRQTNRIEYNNKVTHKAPKKRRKMTEHEKRFPSNPNIFYRTNTKYFS